MLRSYLVGCAAALALGTVGRAAAADAHAGEVLVKQVCSACHAPAGWKGESAPEIDSLIHQVVAGKVAHPRKLELTDAQIADIAAYWAGVANK